jgi:DNA-binding MarR family transcriptional regulator
MPTAKEPRVEELITLLFAIGRIMRKSMHQGKESAHLSALQLETLRYVSENDKPLMKDIAAFLAITPPSATPLIECLVAQGQLKRASDTSDRRGIRLEITAKGKSAINKMISEKRSGIRKLVRGLGAKEQESFINILKKIVATYEKIN